MFNAYCYDNIMMVRDLKRLIQNAPDSALVSIVNGDKLVPIKSAGIVNETVCFGYNLTGTNQYKTQKTHLLLGDTNAPIKQIIPANNNYEYDSQLYPYLMKAIKTLRDYKLAIDFKNVFPCGYDVFDYDLTDGDGDEALLLTHPTLGDKFYEQLEVVSITSHPTDPTCVAFYVNTKTIRKNSRTSDEEFLRIVKDEQKAHFDEEGNLILDSPESYNASEEYIRLFTTYIKDDLII